jgi:hypothetical protein
MIKIRIGQNIQGEIASLSNPTRLSTGFATITEIEPVIENTSKIIMIWKLEVIPHFSLSLFILQK